MPCIRPLGPGPALACIGALFALFALSGCSDLTVPDGALLSCESSDECPTGLECEATSKLCVRPRSGDELTILEAQVTPALVGGPFLQSGEPVVIKLRFSRPPLRAPRVIALRDGLEEAVVTASADSDVDMRAELALGAGVADGRLVFAIDAIDERGIPRRLPLPGGLVIDTTPPALVGVSLLRLPDPRLTPVALDIAGAAAVGPAVAVRIGFATDEVVFLDGDPALGDPAIVEEDDERAPRLALTGSSLRFTRDGQVASPLLFDLSWPADVQGIDGVFRARARVTDLAGNVTEEDLVFGDRPLELFVDATPPAPAAVEVADAVVFERAPWGRADAPRFDVFTVEGAAGSVEPDSIVLVTRDAAGAREIGRVTARSDGSFGGLADLELETGDVREVFVAVADGAGNVSRPVPVRDVRWFATPAGKAVGDEISNPHRFEELPVFTGRLGQGGVFERGDEGDIGAPDGAALRTDGAGSWERVATDDGAPLVSATPAAAIVEPAFGYDPVRGQAVLFGGSETFRFEGGGTFDVAQARCGGATDDLFVRGGDGRWRRVVPAVDQPAPTGMRGGRFAFDTRRNALVLSGVAAGGAELWSFVDGVFTQLCTSAACAASMPAGLIQHGAAFDPIRKVLVVHGGGLGSATYEWDGVVWRQACGGGIAACAETSGGRGGLVWDENLERVVWFDGATLAAWDGATWAPLCIDEACAATAPPPRANAQIAFDRARRQIVAFGGEEPAGACSFETQLGRPPEPDVPPSPQPYGDTWLFDGQRWREATPATASPPPRALHAMGWDERRGRVLVIGGDDCNCMQRIVNEGFRLGFDEDAWEWDGSSWERVDTFQTPAGFTRAPQLALRDHKMTPAPAHDGVLLYGDFADTLHLFKDGRLFRSVAGIGSAAATFLAGFATTPDGEVFIMGGGGASSGGAGPAGTLPFALHVVDNSVSPVCVPDPSCGLPTLPSPPPFGHGFAADGERLVSFGGSRSGGGSFGFVLSDLATDELFVFTRETGWTDPCAAGSCGPRPPRRMRAGLSATEIAGQTLLFGGAPFDPRTWTFDGSTWTERAVTSVPAVRHDHVITFDPERSAVMMTAGTDDNATNDTRGGDQIRALSPVFDLVWEWSQDDWHLAREVDPEGDGRPSRRYGAAAAADPLGGGVLVHGGTPSPARVFGAPDQTTPRLADLWRWRGGSDTRPAHRFAVQTNASGIEPPDALLEAELRWLARALDTSGAIRSPELFFWDGFGWRALPAASCGEGCLLARLGGDELLRAMNGPRAEIVVAAVGVENGPAPGYSSIATDAIEVSLRYRRP
jgi:hypothetical protein